MLSSILRRTANNGCVTCCGLVAGAELALTVYPFILRGIHLAGIDRRSAIWLAASRSGTAWHSSADQQSLNRITTTVSLESLGSHVTSMLAGQSVGRVVVRL